MTKRMMIACAAGSVMTCLAMASAAAAPAASPRGASSVILWCDCDTPGKRARIQRAIGRAGGRTIYVYEQMGGFAVAIPASRDPASVRRKLRAIAGVHAVQQDRVVRLGRPGEPQ